VPGPGPIQDLGLLLPEEPLAEDWVELRSQWKLVQFNFSDTSADFAWLAFLARPAYSSTWASGRVDSVGEIALEPSGTCASRRSESPFP